MLGCSAQKPFLRLLYAFPTGSTPSAAAAAFSGGGSRGRGGSSGTAAHVTARAPPATRPPGGELPRWRELPDSELPWLAILLSRKESIQQKESLGSNRF